jgi:anti-sigma regulatory factor (Ser/Thr protein kinase)
MMVGTDNELRFSLPADPESVGLARAAVAAMARGLGMQEPALGDLRTIVSEACTNVVRHAYPEGGGNFDVEAVADGDALTIVVRDFGRGIQPQFRNEQPSLRLGLGLISSLSSHFEISGGQGGGTEVTMIVRPIS